MPGPLPGYVRPVAPAGMNASRPLCSNPTHPPWTVISPTPCSSIVSVYAQPRSMAVADGVSMTNWPAGAQICAWIVPRTSSARCSPGVAVTSRSREPGCDLEAADPADEHHRRRTRVGLHPTSGHDLRMARERRRGDGRHALDAGHAPGLGRQLLPWREPCGADRDQRERSSGQPCAPGQGRLARRTRHRQRERGPLLRRRCGELREQRLEARHVLIGRSRAIPEILVVHRIHQRVLVAAVPSSACRKSFMPRHRLTRTESGVRPVRRAISGPVIPSTSRRTSVSR